VDTHPLVGRIPFFQNILLKLCTLPAPRAYKFGILRQ
jgi:hypothetical protein